MRFGGGVGDGEGAVGGRLGGVGMDGDAGRVVWEHLSYGFEGSVACI